MYVSASLPDGPRYALLYVAHDHIALLVFHDVHELAAHALVLYFLTVLEWKFPKMVLSSPLMFLSPRLLHWRRGKLSDLPRVMYRILSDCRRWRRPLHVARVTHCLSVFDWLCIGHDCELRVLRACQVRELLSAARLLGGPDRSTVLGFECMSALRRGEDVLFWRFQWYMMPSRWMALRYESLYGGDASMM
jgi:hypothetical protein